MCVTLFSFGYVMIVMILCSNIEASFLSVFLSFKTKLQVMLSSSSQHWPSTTFPESLPIPANCIGAGEAAATERCLRLNIATLSQTEWCHHWADELHYNRPPMCSLFQKNLIDQNQSAHRISCAAGYAAAVAGKCVPACLRVCIYVSVCPCIHLFIPAPPSFHWQLACLRFSHWHRALAGA